MVLGSDERASHQVEDMKRDIPIGSFTQFTTTADAKEASRIDGDSPFLAPASKLTLIFHVTDACVLATP